MELKKRRFCKNPKQQIGRDRRFLFFSGFNFLYWSVMSASSFVVLFLYDQGFSNSQVGISLAVNSGAAFLALPIWGIIADKIGSKRKTLMILLAGTFLASSLAALLTGNVLLTMLFLALTVSCRGSLSSIVDSWVIDNVNMPDTQGRRFNYGSVRLYGSLGFFTAGMLFYYAINSMGISVKYSFLGSAVFAGACFAILLLHRNEYSMAGSGRIASLKLSQLAPGRLFKNFYFITFVIVFMLINVPGYLGLSYVSNLLDAVGGIPAFVGAIGSVRALCEIPMLFFSKTLIRKAGYIKIIFLIGSLLLLGQLGCVFCSSVWQVLALQMLHGAMNGLLMGAAVGYIFSLVPRELSSTAQTIAVASCFIISIAGNLCSGFILDVFGIRELYLVCAVCAGLGIILFAGSLLMGRLAKIRKYDPEVDEFSKTILTRLSKDTVK